MKFITSISQQLRIMHYELRGRPQGIVPYRCISQQLRIMNYKLNKDSPYVGFHNNSALRIMHYALRIPHYYVQKHLFLLTILVKS